MSREIKSNPDPLPIIYGLSVLRVLRVVSEIKGHACPTCCGSQEPQRVAKAGLRYVLVIKLSSPSTEMMASCQQVGINYKQINRGTHTWAFNSRSGA